jgi:hypothetical protein
MTAVNGTNTRMLWWVIGVMATIILAGGGGAFNYTQTHIIAGEDATTEVERVNGAQNERLATLEAHYNEILRRLGRIEDKIDGRSQGGK